MPNTPRRRLYGEPEIRDILQRAAALQESAVETPASGLSADELEHLGEEVGIDPRYIRAAIEGTRLPTERATQSGGFFGAPTMLQAERTFDGEVTDAEWEDIVHELRQRYGGPGVAGKLGQTYEWSHKLPHTSDTIYVTLTPRRGQTRLRLKLPNNNVLGGFYGAASPLMIFALVIGFGALNHIPLVGALVAILGFLAVFLGTRALVSSHFKRREGIVGEVLDEIELLIEPDEAEYDYEADDLDAVPESHADVSEAPPLAGVLDDEVPAAPAAEAARRKRTRRSRR